MARDTTPSFIHELRLKVTPQQAKVLDKRLEVARQIYNACLGEALRRLQRMRGSKAYQKALKMPKQVKSATGELVANKERQLLYKEAASFYQFRKDYDLHAYVKWLCKGTWLGEHIDSHVAQKLATRAFNAVKDYGVGTRGKPRFRPKNRFSSVEGKSNATGIRWRDGKVKWNGIDMRATFDQKDKDGLECYALSCRTKYVRLVKRVMKSKSVWYVQLVQEGKPYMKGKHPIGDALVGLDLGPSTIAVVGETQAKLQAFCPEIEDYSKEIKRLQRKMNRSQRAMNSDNYAPDTLKTNSNGKSVKKLGKVKKGAKKWVKSHSYLAKQYRVAELQRKLAETRKRAHGELANEILTLGKTIKTEKLSYKAFQRMFGKSVGTRAPGLFLEKLRYKAANAGGEVIEFNTRTTALSQTCQCGHKEKKRLKDRWHHCPICGIRAQRDLYSAYLARFVETDRLDTHQALEAWSGAGILLEQAVSNLNETAISKARLASFGLAQRQSGSSAKKESVQHKALDVVACDYAQVRAKESVVSCP